MISLIATVLIALWLYRTALSKGHNPWLRIFGGLIIFYLSMQIWSGYIIKPFIGQETFYRHSFAMASAIEISAVVVGGLFVYLLEKLIMSDKQN